MIQVAVVGAGVAGLVAAHRLRRAGVDAVIYEAAHRVGGRVETLRDYFEGQVVELGAEFVSSNHSALRTLVGDLGVELDDLEVLGPSDVQEVWFVGGERYEPEQAIGDFAAVRPALVADLVMAGPSPRYDAHTPAAAELDRTSAAAWIDSRVPGGRRSRLGRLLELAWTVEFGADASDVGALALVHSLAGLPEGEFRPFGTTDERYRIRGGADRLTSAIAEPLAVAITVRRRLVSASTERDGSVRLTLQADGAVCDVVCEHAILALPFAVLRTLDLHGVRLSPLKREAIAELGMARHAKLLVEFAGRPWYSLGASGDTLSDTGYQCTWEGTWGQAGPNGVLVDYRACAAPTVDAEVAARRFLQELEPVLPEVAHFWTGRAVLADWSATPDRPGSYSYYQVGQQTRFGGIEELPEDRLHFAGEHTSLEFQGYLEGAVRSGERAAAEVLEALS